VHKVKTKVSNIRPIKLHLENSSVTTALELRSQLLNLSILTIEIQGINSPPEKLPAENHPAKLRLFYCETK
jgi:hypothetical protein